jgi:hypothetical protein
MFQGSQRLDWNFNPDVEILAGQVRTLTFQASATMAPGEYWNQVWVDLDEFSYSAYSWPTALVEAMGVFQTDATDGESTASSEIWLGSDAYLVAYWEISR